MSESPQPPGYRLLAIGVFCAIALSVVNLGMTLSVWTKITKQEIRVMLEEPRKRDAPATVSPEEFAERLKLDELREMEEKLAAFRNEYDFMRNADRRMCDDILKKLRENGINMLDAEHHVFIDEHPRLRILIERGLVPVLEVK